MSIRNKDHEVASPSTQPRDAPHPSSLRPDTSRDPPSITDYFPGASERPPSGFDLDFMVEEKSVFGLSQELERNASEHARSRSAPLLGKVEKQEIEPPTATDISDTQPNPETGFKRKEADTPSPVRATTPKKAYVNKSAVDTALNKAAAEPTADSGPQIKPLRRNQRLSFGDERLCTRVTSPKSDDVLPHNVKQLDSPTSNSGLLPIMQIRSDPNCSIPYKSCKASKKMPRFEMVMFKWIRYSIFIVAPPGQTLSMGLSARAGSPERRLNVVLHPKVIYRVFLQCNESKEYLSPDTYMTFESKSPGKAQHSAPQVTGSVNTTNNENSDRRSRGLSQRPSNMTWEDPNADSGSSNTACRPLFPQDNLSEMPLELGLPHNQHEINTHSVHRTGMPGTPMVDENSNFSTQPTPLQPDKAVARVQLQLPRC